MKKQITRPCADNEVTRQQQRKLLTSINIVPLTGMVTLNIEIQQLSNAGTPLPLQIPDNKPLVFHGQTLNTPTGIQEPVVNPLVEAYKEQVYTLTEQLWADLEAEGGAE